MKKNHQVCEVSGTGIQFRHSDCKYQVSLRLLHLGILTEEPDTAEDSHYIRHRYRGPQPWWQRQWVPVHVWLPSLSMRSYFGHLPPIKLWPDTSLSDLHFSTWKKWRLFYYRNKILRWCYRNWSADRSLAPLMKLGKPMSSVGIGSGEHSGE